MEEYPVNGTKEQKFWYVYKKAKALGDKFPEVTAAQYAHESAYGTSNIANEYNNPFGQTEVGDKKGARKWKKFDSIDSAIAHRVKKWSPKYADAKDPITAMAKIQPSYSPNSDGNAGYMKAVATYLKQYKFYNGDVNIPNADVNPEFYGQGRAFNKEKRYAYTQDVVDKNYKDYNKRLADIQKRKADGKEPEDLLNQEAMNLQIEYQKKGFIPFFNNEIQKENEAKTPEIEKKAQQIVELTSALEDADIVYYLDDKGQQQIANISVNANSSNNKKVQELAKKYPSLFNKKNNFHYDFNLEPFFNKIEKDYEDLTGEKFDFYNKGKRGKDLNIDVSKTSVIANKINETFGSKNPYSGKTKLAKPITQENVVDKSKRKLKPLLEVINLPEDPYEEPPVQEELSTTDPERYTEEDLKKVEAFNLAKKEKQAKDDNLNNIRAYFENEARIPSQYQEEEFKDNFPYVDVLTGIAGAVFGLDMANKKIPMRDEQVSDAMRDYTAELSKLSQIGLRPEDESYAKQMLAEAYQSNLNMITSASGGNRNLVLGNLSAVENQRQEGLLKLGLAESAAKNEALVKYGEAIRYINDFDSNRDIANNERKYQNAMMTKQAGGQLAGAAFNSILENIQLAKENAPGSINQIIKSHYHREWFGVDTTLKDDGSGTQPYTVSWKIKQDAENIKKAENFNAFRKDFMQLGTDKQKALGDFAAENSNQDDMFKFVDYLKENDISGKEMKKENMSKAFSSGDMSLLYSEGEALNQIAKNKNSPNPEIKEQDIMSMAFENDKLAEQYNYPIFN